MIKSLAPLGATHDIVLILAYGEIPQSLRGVETEAPHEHSRDVTVTAHLKPKAGAKGEPRHLQFKGPAAEVEAELAKKLPQAVAKIAAHLASLDELDQQLAAEKKQAQEEAQKKLAAAKQEAAKPAPKKASAPAKPAAKKVAAKTSAKPHSKPQTQNLKPAGAKPAGAAEAAVAAITAAAQPATETAQATAAEDPLTELARIANATAPAEDAVEL